MTEGSGPPPRTIELGIAGCIDAVEIGRGGFGVVYRARQPRFDRVVAVKFVSGVQLDDAASTRFERELQAMGKLSDHPNIVTVHDAGVTAAGNPYIVMAYEIQGSLADRIAAGGPLSWPDAVAHGIKVAGALETAHRAGVLHRDVKPENILVSRYGEPKLADFGIARIEGLMRTATGFVTASIPHAAPELLDGAPPSVRTDVYALGSTIYALMLGRPVFVETTDEGLVPVLTRIVTKPVPDMRPRGVPDPVCRAVERAMAKSADQRHASALDLARELQAAQHALGLPMTQCVLGDTERPGLEVTTPLVPDAPPAPAVRSNEPMPRPAPADAAMAPTVVDAMLAPTVDVALETAAAPTTALPPTPAGAAPTFAFSRQPSAVPAPTAESPGARPGWGPPPQWGAGQAGGIPAAPPQPAPWGAPTVRPASRAGVDLPFIVALVATFGSTIALLWAMVENTRASAPVFRTAVALAFGAVGAMVMIAGLVVAGGVGLFMTGEQPRHDLGRRVVLLGAIVAAFGIGVFGAWHHFFSNLIHLPAVAAPMMVAAGAIAVWTALRLRAPRWLVPGVVLLVALTLGIATAVLHHLVSTAHASTVTGLAGALLAAAGLVAALVAGAGARRRWVVALPVVSAVLLATGGGALVAFATSPNVGPTATLSVSDHVILSGGATADYRGQTTVTTSGSTCADYAQLGWDGEYRIEANFTAQSGSAIHFRAYIQPYYGPGLASKYETLIHLDVGSATYLDYYSTTTESFTTTSDGSATLSFSGLSSDTTSARIAGTVTQTCIG